MENELIKYIEENPEVELMKGLTNTNKWSVRPMNWCGCWKSDKCVGGRCLAYFDTKEELDKTLEDIYYLISNKDKPKEIEIKSEVLNNDYISQYHEPFKILKFKNVEQLSKYQDSICGKDNVWGSWQSCIDKFNFPCYIVLKYQKHPVDDSYTAIYLTLEEFKNDLNNVIKTVNELK